MVIRCRRRAAICGVYMYRTRVVCPLFTHTVPEFHRPTLKPCVRRGDGADRARTTGVLSSYLFVCSCCCLLYDVLFLEIYLKIQIGTVKQADITLLTSGFYSTA